MTKKIMIGMIHRGHFILDHDGKHDYVFANFAFGTDAVSFWNILDSAFSTPARYVQELLLRLFCIEDGQAPKPKFIFNPLFEADWLVVVQVIEALGRVSDFQVITVFTDKEGVPVGYLFPDWFHRKDAHYLTLLSTVDGVIDLNLCRNLFFCDVQCVLVERFLLRRLSHNGFVYGDNIEIYKWVAERAIAVLGVLAKSRSEISVVSRDALSFTALMPQHAGDALFFALAWNGTNSHVQSLAVNRAYFDIVSEVAPSLLLVPIDHPPANRNEESRKGNTTPDHEYFFAIRDALPCEGFYYYCRPSRDYNKTKFHLVDHFSFALGRQSCDPRSFLSRCYSQAVFTPADPKKPVRVLLHFDAGWPLKVYPAVAQDRLISILHAKGYEITVLAGEIYQHPKCRVVIFQDYGVFKELVKSHHVIVGMDSFPCHYSAWFLGLPTVCLFGSTRPDNSNAPNAINYAYLEKGLRCRPCYGVVRCPLYGGSHCLNFVAPEKVLDAVEGILAMAEKSNKTDSIRPDCGTEEVRCCLEPIQMIGKVKRISFSGIRVQIAIASAVLPCTKFFSLVYTEFFDSVAREGLLLTMMRTLRFLRRSFYR